MKRLTIAALTLTLALAACTPPPPARHRPAFDVGGSGAFGGGAFGAARPQSTTAQITNTTPSAPTEQKEPAR